MQQLSVTVQCHKGDLEEFIYRAAHEAGAVTGGPAEGDILYVSLFMPAIEQVVKKSKYDSIASKLKAEGRIIFKKRPFDKKKGYIQIFSCAAIFSVDEAGTFTFKK